MTCRFPTPNAQSVFQNKEGLSLQRIPDKMKHLREIKIVHAEASESITPEMKSEIEVLFADLLFEAWLKEKNHPPGAPAPGSSA